MKKARVSLCIIAKNEERFLDQCLRSVQGIADEIVLVDTGSTDATLDIAKTHGAQICRYPWNDSFADARNHAIGLAKGDWVLVMDADEVFEAQDKQRFIDYINTTRFQGCHFVIINYIGSTVGDGNTLHNSLRLFRNNGIYQYEGAIHEQINRVDGKEISPGSFDLQDIRIHHYGYLNNVVQEKNKRERNIPIIERLLEKNPDDSFMRFNMGNEYMAAGNPLAGLEQYDRAYAHIELTQAYAPHLFYRRAMCLHALHRMNAALSTLTEGLAAYPACTDYEFLRATIHAECGHYTLAADGFEKCLRMGEPPSVLKFMEDCATTRPLLALGQMYRQLGDDVRAIDCHVRAFNMDNTKRHILYSLAELYAAHYSDPSLVEEAIWGCLTSREHVPNLLVAADILLHLHLPDRAKNNLDRACALEGCDSDKAYLKAKLHFADQEYAASCALLLDTLTAGKEGQVLAGILPDSATWLATGAMIDPSIPLTQALEFIHRYCDGITTGVYTQAAKLLAGDDTAGLLEGGNEVYPVLTTLFGRMLRVGQFPLFEKLLNLYNHMESKAVLIHLADVYLENGYQRIAVQQVLRSIKELDYLDDRGIDILSKSRALQ